MNKSVLTLLDEVRKSPLNKNKLFQTPVAAAELVIWLLYNKTHPTHPLTHGSPQQTELAPSVGDAPWATGNVKLERNDPSFIDSTTTELCWVHAAAFQSSLASSSVSLRTSSGHVVHLLLQSAAVTALLAHTPLLLQATWRLNTSSGASWQIFSESFAQNSHFVKCSFTKVMMNLIYIQCPQLRAKNTNTGRTKRSSRNNYMFYLIQP